MFLNVACVTKTCKLNFFPFHLDLYATNVVCVSKKNESRHDTLIGFLYFSIIMNSFFFVTHLYWNEGSTFKKKEFKGITRSTYKIYIT